MMGAKTIGCVNHPGVEAIGRCRQCSKPVCKACGITAASGTFCSEVCREKYEVFVKRAQDVGLSTRTRRPFFLRIKNFFGGLITLAAVLFAIGFVASIVYIPVLSDLTATVRGWVGF